MTGKDSEQGEVEKLLRRDARSALPFLELLRLYLHPFALFMDASRGTFLAKRRAMLYNRARRWMLLTYARRWTLIAASFFVSITPFEMMSTKVPAAAVAVVCCFALVVTGWTLCVYLLLGVPAAQTDGR